MGYSATKSVIYLTFLMQKLRSKDEIRNAVVSDIYDVILYPEKMQEFLKNWDDYLKLSHIPDARDQSPKQNSNDHELESHFQRMFLLLDRLLSSENPTDSDRNVLLSMDANGTIFHQGEKSLRKFGELSVSKDIAKFLDRESRTVFKSFLAAGNSSDADQQIRVLNLESGEHLILGRRKNPASGIVAYDFRDLSITWTDDVRELATSQFKLTNRELELLVDLCELGSLEAIGKQTGQNKNTLRIHLKSVFRKLNVRSQAEATKSIAVLAYLSTLYGSPDEMERFADAVGIRKHIGLNDGQTMPVHIVGPKGGRPVIFIHGMLHGISLTKRAVNALYEQNLRLYIPSRANFGDGPTDPDTSDMPQRFADHISQAIKQLGLEKVLMLGHLSGALYAFVAAKALPEQTLGVVNVSGGVPIKSIEQLNFRSVRQRAFAYTARFAPSLFPALAQAAINQIRTLGARQKMDDMYPQDTADNLAIQDPEIARVVMDGYEFTIRQGYKGFAGDAKHVVRDWSGDYVKGLRHPVLLLHGEDDLIVNAKYAEAFAQSEGFNLELVENGGQMILYTKPDVVFAAISRFLSEEC